MTWFNSTQTTEARCPRCHTPLLTALDEGMPARVDAIPLTNTTAEIAALLDGRKTYTHTTNHQLAYRNPTRIRDHTLTGTIHAEHKCAGPQQLLLDDMIGWK